MTRTEFQVTGMTCSHCEQSVSTEASQVAGVDNVEDSAATVRRPSPAASRWPTTRADGRAVTDYTTPRHDLHPIVFSDRLRLRTFQSTSRTTRTER